MAATKGSHPESHLVEKGLPCPQPDCTSSDGAALYDDGHTYCFVCRKTWREDGTSPRPAPKNPDEDAPEDLIAFLATGHVKAIPSRGLTQETCREWDYRVRVNPRNGNKEQLAPYRDGNGKLVNIKVRNLGEDGTGKEFYWINGGSAASGILWGMHKWAKGGRQLTILEGEIDAATVSQAYTHKYAVVSVPGGAQHAAKAVAANLEWVSSFDRINIGFDMDAPGREAAIEVARLLPPGKAFIVKWPGQHKDPNAVLVGEKGATDGITRAVWQAESYRPDGIVDARTLTAQCLAPVVTGLPWPWQFMTEWTYGRRYGEAYTFGGGTGIGKTQVVAEIVASTLSGTTKYGETYTPEAVGIFAYEAGAATTKKAIAGALAGKRFHLPQHDAGWTDDELRAELDRMDVDLWERGGKLFINDSRGSADWDAVVERARYLRHAENVRHIIVDPISALVTNEDDERKFLDRMVLEAAKLSVELECCIYLLSHLTRPKEGKAHEEGGQVRLSQFRGSNAIGMFSNFVFGLERNQQAETAEDRSKTVFRVVKDRLSGNSVGSTAAVHYDAISGTLDESNTGAIFEPAPEEYT
jgi:twinkle protein